MPCLVIYDSPIGPEFVPPCKRKLHKNQTYSCGKCLEAQSIKCHFPETSH